MRVITLPPQAQVRTPQIHGDGSDGSVTITEDITLTRDMYYMNLTVPAGRKIQSNGFRIFVRNVLRNRGHISFDATDLNWESVRPVGTLQTSNLPTYGYDTATSDDRLFNVLYGLGGTGGKGGKSDGTQTDYFGDVVAPIASLGGYNDLQTLLTHKWTNPVKLHPFYKFTIGADITIPLTTPASIPWVHSGDQWLTPHSNSTDPDTINLPYAGLWSIHFIGLCTLGSSNNQYIVDHVPYTSQYDRRTFTAGNTGEIEHFFATWPFMLDYCLGLKIHHAFLSDVSRTMHRHGSNGITQLLIYGHDLPDDRIGAGAGGIGGLGDGTNYGGNGGAGANNGVISAFILDNNDGVISADGYDGADAETGDAGGGGGGGGGFISLIYGYLNSGSEQALGGAGGSGVGAGADGESGGDGTVVYAPAF